MSFFTEKQFEAAMPRATSANRARCYPFLRAAMLEFQINTPQRAAAFIANIAHETANLRYMEEIASGSAYEGRRDLGNTQPGDGRRFKGRGAFQLTGRANYEKYGRLLGVNLIASPTLAALPQLSFRIAGLYWKDRNLNYYADRRDLESITRRINGGLNGHAERVRNYDVALRALSAMTPTATSGGGSVAALVVAALVLK